MAEVPSTGSVVPTDEDRSYLLRAKALAWSGWGHVHPNPMVGCVIVRDGRIVGEGWHEEFGAAHAEVNALATAGECARGATAYVSLEPCDHVGKTPPCSHALIQAGVSVVMFGAADPATDSGGGEARLAAAGVQVVGPVDSVDEARRANPAFFHRVEHATPYVALKLAASQDGFVAAKEGECTPISGSEAHAWVHRLRAGFDAIMVGAATARIDDPQLTVRGDVTPRMPPTRVILDPRASLEPRAALFEPPLSAPVLLFATEEAPQSRRSELEAAGAEVVVVGSAPDGCSLAEVMEACWTRDLGSILCEGGPRLADRLIEAHIPERLYLLRAPHTIGPQGVPMRVDPERGWHPITEAVPLGVDQLLILERGR